jgi:hypothetical protein
LIIIIKFDDISFFVETANLIATFKHRNMQYLGRQFYDILKELVELSDLTRRNLMINVVPWNKSEFLRK